MYIGNETFPFREMNAMTTRVRRISVLNRFYDVKEVRELDYDLT